MAIGPLLDDIPLLLGAFAPANDVNLTRFILLLRLSGNPWRFNFCPVDPFCAKDILGEALGVAPLGHGLQRRNRQVEIATRSVPLRQTEDCMGAIAEAMVAYVQPLLDETDGSLEQMNRALGIAQLCWNLALFPEERKHMLADMRLTLQMDDEEFESLQRNVILPMIRRHIEMFPRMHRSASWKNSSDEASAPMRPPEKLPAKKYAGTERNAPCPCNSGKKYKKCCGR